MLYVSGLRIRNLQERLKFHMVFKHNIIAHGTYRILFYTGLSNQLLLFLVYGKSIDGYAPLSRPNALCSLLRVVYYYNRTTPNIIFLLVPQELRLG